MANSFEEALKKAGVTKDQFKQLVKEEQRQAKEEQKDEQDVDFPRLMKKKRVVVVQQGPKKVSIAHMPSDVSTSPAKAASLRPPSEVKVSGGLNQYLGKLESVYGGSKKKIASTKPKAASAQVLEVLGPIVPSRLLVTNDLLEAHVVSPGNDGIASQLANVGTERDEFDITIGLDFGTSTVKAIVRDSVSRAFAIPFLRHDTNNPYLLPSRVFELRGVYQLEKNGTPHRTLKLSVLEKEPTESDFERAVAFLALVIRYCRGWLLATKAEVYANAHLNWAVNVGLPSANYQDSTLVDRFKALAAAAMSLAADAEKVLKSDLVKRHWGAGQKLVQRGKPGPLATPSGVVDVVPEIAAQVHGFVQSTRFDPKAPNVYMMVDIGAGTVDASIFHVRREAGATQGFVCFGNTVEQNGAINLHRARIQWLREQFAKINPPNAAADRELDLLERPTDRLTEIPESIRDYFGGVALRLQGIDQNPDEHFFTRRYWRQVFGETFMAVRTRKLSVEQLYGLPTFLTGGGARMHYYERLVRQMNNNTNLKWARIDQVQLEIPQGLEAPGLRQSDFDRLSVAYGLSFVRLGTYVRAQEVPDLPAPVAPDHFDPFISKDQM